MYQTELSNFVIGFHTEIWLNTITIKTRKTATPSYYSDGYYVYTLCIGLYYITLYRVIQKERSIFREVIVSVIVRKTTHINMCLNLMIAETKPPEIYEYKGIVNGKKKRSYLLIL